MDAALVQAGGKDTSDFVEIAGYTMTPALALGLEQATMTPPPSQGRRLEWIDLSAREGADLSPVSSKTCAAWSGAGYGVRCHVVQGPSFWQTVEIEDVPALVASKRICAVPSSGASVTMAIGIHWAKCPCNIKGPPLI